ncbi:ABC transporter ATP-binding protein [Microbacterium sp. NPDC090218]
MSREDDASRVGELLLEASGIDVVYGRGSHARQVLFDVGLQLRAGEAVGIIGETGSGKTSFARALLGLKRPDAGTVVVGGEDITTYSAARWRRFRRDGVIQYVFQDPLKSLDPERTLGESLAEPLELQGALGRPEIAARIASYLNTVALPDSILHRFPAEISGGQRQRVAIARALITDPKVIVLDEPVSALDSANRSTVLGILAKLRDSGVALVFISHDLGSVAGLTDRTLVLFRGHVVEEGATAQIVNSPRHPYTRLLIGSAPTLGESAIGRAERDELRALLSVEAGR